jgi:multidrug efflux pump subunit AcrB
MSILPVLRSTFSASLVRAIGLVVDDAIVVLENVYRHGWVKTERAALDGSSEISLLIARP